MTVARPALCLDFPGKNIEAASTLLHPVYRLAEFHLVFRAVELITLEATVITGED